SGIGSISAEGRSQLIEDKIKKIADDYSFDPKDIHVTENEGEYLIDGSDQHIVSIRETDLPEGQTLEKYAGAVASKISAEIATYRAERTPNSISLGLLYTLLSTAGLIIAIVILNRAQRFITHRSFEFAETYVVKLKIKSYQLISPYRIKQLIKVVISALKVLTVLILVYFYVPLVLSFFPWTARFAPEIINYILNPIRQLFAVVFAYAPNLFYIFIILAFTHYTLKVIRLIFNEIELGNLTFNGFHKEWAQPTFKLFKFVSYAISFVMIFPYLPGSSSPAFQGLSVFLGVLVSFGSGSAIANVVSGIVMTYMRPFKVGDRVKIAETVGDILEKNFLVTRIRTIKNVDVTIPNAMVLGSHIVNYSSSAEDEGLILNTTVTIGYDAPWRRVHELLQL
ncbi:MAG: mechanosensitive ion channel, partial [Proteobacteria bacterium]